MKLGRKAVYCFANSPDARQLLERLKRIEELENVALWSPEVLGCQAFAPARHSKNLVIVGGIASVYARSAMATKHSEPEAPKLAYRNNWSRMGFANEESAHGCTDRFIDAVVASGTATTVHQRTRAHLYQSALTPIGMRAGLTGRPRAKSMRYRPAFRLYKGQRQCRLVLDVGAERVRIQALHPTRRALSDDDALGALAA